VLEPSLALRGNSPELVVFLQESIFLELVKARVQRTRPRGQTFSKLAFHFLHERVTFNAIRVFIEDRQDHEIEGHFREHGGSTLRYSFSNSGVPVT
jgi:hypothetical protein